ncbi:MAG: aspartate aminotransferase family protein [Bacteroidales bacterium]|nr:aspartate aminotransferase family protein [Bacteroidales bacterium]
MEHAEEFRKYGHQMVDWISDYFKNIEKYPVKSNLEPGQVFRQIPENPPEKPETADRLLADFEKIILPGMTHWQSPNFYAYFPANSSYPSVLGEMLTAAMGAQCMKWETSPAATELEEAVMNWLRKMTGLPENFTGVIQDGASTATLCAILTAREKYTAFRANHEGMNRQPAMRVYCSAEAHSSVEKAVKIAGIGKDNLVKIPVDEVFSLIPEKLEEAIIRDLQSGYKPLCTVAAMGTTSSTAVDPLEDIGLICSRYSIWLHVDAAFSGSALILPEYRWMLTGIERVDSFVFNPHKWLFTNFDCSAYYVKDTEALINTFKLVPEYLKSQLHEHVNDFSNWGIQLGRRFRALKLWFVLRSFGLNEIQKRLRGHIHFASLLKQWIDLEKNFEILAPVTFNLVCFRFHPEEINNEEDLDRLNETLLKEINRTGKMYLSHTRLAGKYTLRMVVAQTYVEEQHVHKAWKIIYAKSEEMYQNFIKNE